MRFDKPILKLKPVCRFKAIICVRIYFKIKYVYYFSFQFLTDKTKNLFLNSPEN